MALKSNANGTRNLVVRVSPDAQIRLRVVAAAHGMTPSEYIRAFLNAAFDSEDPKVTRTADFAVAMSHAEIPFKPAAKMAA